MSQPRKAMKNMGFQGCCLRCDAKNVVNLKRCKRCIESHITVRNLINDVNGDSILNQHMRDLFAMLSKPNKYDTDEIHGEELLIQQSLIRGVSFDEGYKYPDDISVLFNKKNLGEKGGLGGEKSRNSSPLDAEFAKMIGEDIWGPEELLDIEYSGKRTNPNKDIIEINKKERVGEDIELSLRMSGESSDSVDENIILRKKWSDMIEDLDEILDN